MTQTLCLSLQPLSASGILSSSSATSNRSRNKTRYRTKAVSSEVDENLFGRVKVTRHPAPPGGRLVEAVTGAGVAQDRASAGQASPLPGDPPRKT